MNATRYIAVATVLMPFTAWSVLTVEVAVVDQTCNYSNGSAVAQVSGGTPPYSFIWNNGSTLPGIQGLSPGIYSVTVTDALSAQVMAQGEVLSLPYQLEGVLSGMPWCVSPRNAFEDPLASGLLNTWTVNGMPTTLSGGGFIQFDTQPWDMSYNYPIDDGNGCTGTVTGTNGPQITSWPTLTINNIDPSCDNAPIGAIQISAASVAGPGSSLGPLINIVRLDGPPVFQAFYVTTGPLVVDFIDLPPGDYAIHWWLGITGEDLDPGVCSYDSLFVTVPNLGSTCGYVSGISYYDVDGDCVKDPAEIGVPFSPLLIQPGGAIALTNSSGGFQFPLTNGSYTIEQTDPTLIPICPSVQPVAFNVNTNPTVIDFANGSTAPLDLGVFIASGPSRPGFDVNIHGSASNLSPQVSGAVTVTMTLDPLVSFINAVPTPSTVVGNTLTWEFPAFSSFNSASMHVLANVPVGTTIGTILTHSIVASNTDPEPDLANNSSNVLVTVVGSFDPNDKTAMSSTRSSFTSYFIDQDEYIDYTIRFQNTGTAEALFVIVTDTLSEDLNMLSFEQGVASHAFDVSFKPDRVVEWRFDNINLPDSNTNEAASHGLVSFRIKPVLPLLPGTEIENIANIYFDFNDPVITEPSVLVAEFSTGVEEASASVLKLFPNPAKDGFAITCDQRMTGIKLLSVCGHLVYAEQAFGNRKDLDVDHLNAGTYIVDVALEDGMHLRSFFVKE